MSRVRRDPRIDLAPWVLSVLALVPGLVWALAGDLNALVNRGFLLEDSFYYFSLARRLLAGDGLTLDGLQPTSGFHPLHLALLLPGAALGSEGGFLRYALILGAATHAATVFFLWRLGMRLFGPGGALAAAGLWALSLASRLQHLNGMETGLLLLLCVLSVQKYLEARLSPATFSRAYLYCGAWLGLGYLARVDALFLAASMGADLILGKRGFRPAAAMGIGFLALVLPWMAGSKIATGAFFPDSGRASTFLAQESGGDYLHDQWGRPEEAPGETWGNRPLRARLENASVYALVSLHWSPPFFWSLGFSHFSIFGPWKLKPVPHFLFERPWWIFILLSPIAAFAFFEARKRGVLFLGLFAASLSAAYVLLPAPPWFAARYMAPLILMGTLLLSGALGQAALRTVLGRFIGTAVLGFFLAASVQQHRAIWPSPRVPEGYHAQALRMKSFIPPGARVGCFQAGVVSYFLNENPVVNLDGVMNRKALKALKENRLAEFVRDNGLEYAADWTVLMDRYFWPRSGLQPGRDAVLIHRGYFDVWKLIPPPGASPAP